MNKDLFEEIIRNLDRGISPDRKWPDKKGEYWAICPFHADDKPGSFSVGEKGFKCFSCNESGNLEKLAKHLGIEIRKFNNKGITLDDYALLKKLPREFLENIGVKEIKRKGKIVVEIPYFDEENNRLAVRLRISGQGVEKFYWRSNPKIIPYGLWRIGELQSCAENGGGKKKILLVEGESDAQTLWFYEQEALGIPGATIWKSEWASYLEGYEVYIWQEPDEAGQKFVERIGKDLPEARVITPPPNRKDISECHVSGDNVLNLINELKKDSRMIRDIHDEEKARDIQAVFEEAKPLLVKPNILNEFGDLCNQMGLVGEEQNAKLIYLAITSRVLENPVSLLIKGPSSGGKSYTLDIVLKAFPKVAYYALTSMSEHAMAYSEEPMSHRFLVIYEATGLNTDIANYLVRSLLSEGRIHYETVEKTQNGLGARIIERLGPTGLILTTTKFRIHPENETRMFSISINEDSEQTRKIIDSIAARAMDMESKRPDTSRWLALQKWITLVGNREVEIPYAGDLASLTDYSAVRMRRDFNKILNLICANAILHQFNRDLNQNGRIIADLKDYRSVYPLIIDYVSEGVDKAVKKTIREIVEAVDILSQEESEISQRELAKYMKQHPGTISRKVNEAIGKGYLINLEEKSGRPHRLILGDPLPDDTGILPTPDELEKIFSSSPPICNATLQESFAQSEGNQCKEERSTEESNTRQHLFLDEYMEIISFSDVGKPCYACGKQNWAPCSDGDGFYCATCHPGKEE